MALTSIWKASQLLSVKSGKAARADRTIIFLAILAHSLAQADADGDPTGVSVHALAMSFNRPFESVRRQVNALLHDGWCTRTSSGIVVDASVLARPDVCALIDQLHDLLVWLTEQYRSFDLPLPSARDVTLYKPQCIALAAIELIIATVDFASLGYDNIREFYIVSCVICGSVRDVTFNPILSRQFGGLTTVPADQFRAGVNVNRLASLLGLAPVTTYRQINKAIARGVLERCDGGVRATTAFLGGDSSRSDIKLAAKRAQRAFQRMALAGFPFDAPATRYLGEVPQLPDWRQ